MGERINADDTVALAPRVSPEMQPLPNTGGQARPRRTPSRVLSTRMFFLANNEIGWRSVVNTHRTLIIGVILTQTVEMVALQLNHANQSNASC